eukprot:TRINITY_DN102204_c0_g1_i1.p1 TRINITY_DN102204_c0_g1~~TRINITY_DN102204_c0_g1_i1.p1  ORF type:complete len:321 (-),score=75.38 TRINITY_DN102204_c0_g1_i1:29-991(-)
MTSSSSGGPGKGNAAGRESPRATAHRKLLEALETDDWNELTEAVGVAKAVGIRGEGLLAAEEALKLLTAGREAESRQLAAGLKLRAALDGRERSKIWAALDEALEAGLISEDVNEAQEMLADMRMQSSQAVEDVVAALEPLVLLAEASRRGTEAPTAVQDKLQTQWQLARQIELAKTIVSAKDAALVERAHRVLDFEAQRSKLLMELERKMTGRCAVMEDVAKRTQDPSYRPIEPMEASQDGGAVPAAPRLHVRPARPVSPATQGGVTTPPSPVAHGGATPVNSPARPKFQLASPRNVPRASSVQGQASRAAQPGSRTPR